MTAHTAFQGALAKMEATQMADNATQTPRNSDNSDVCTVSKSQLLRFFEAKFQMADRDHDGELNIAELSNFLRFVTHPDLRALRSWERYGKPTA